jgi:hypothetical protein
VEVVRNLVGKERSLADAPGSWLTKIKPFQAALIGALVVALVVLGLWGRGNYSLLGLLSVDNREADFRAFIESKVEDEPPEIQRQYLSGLIIAALDVAEGLDEAEQARFATSLEAGLREFDFYSLQDGRLRNRLQLSFGHRVTPDAADEALETRERIATAAIQGMTQLALDKDPPPPFDSLRSALQPLGFLHAESDDLLAFLRGLPPDDRPGPALRQMLYKFEGPFAEDHLFVDAPDDFVAAIHALKRVDQHYYRHEVVTRLWADAEVGEGIFTIERDNVEVRIDPELEPYEAEVCEGEQGAMYGAGFFLVRTDGAIAGVKAKPQSDSQPCWGRPHSDDANLTVWLATADAARLVLNESSPLTAASYPIRGVVLRREPSHNALPPDRWPDFSDPQAIARKADELERIAGL